jgi:single-strand DNA-binding protein
MSGHCTITIVGNLGRDPERKNIGDGLARFSVAVGRSHKDKRSDEWIEETDWFDVSAWGAKADYAMDNLTKGSPVTVVGRMKSRKHEGVTYWEIVAQHLQAGVRRAKREPVDDGKSTTTRPRNNYGRDAEGDDGIPF